VHCDIKPENILPSKGDGNPRARLADFGSAQVLNKNRGPSSFTLNECPSNIARSCPQAAELSQLKSWRADATFSRSVTEALRIKRKS
jgi:serine/threonine protein kinase